MSIFSRTNFWLRAALSLTMLATVSPALSADVKNLYDRCTKTKTANACLELGAIYAKSNEPGDRELAKKYISYGCRLKENKSCSGKQSLALAKSFLAARAPAANGAAKKK